MTTFLPQVEATAKLSGLGRLGGFIHRILDELRRASLAARRHEELRRKLGPNASHAASRAILHQIYGDRVRKAPFGSDRAEAP